MLQLSYYNPVDKIEELNVSFRIQILATDQKWPKVFFISLTKIKHRTVKTYKLLVYKVKNYPNTSDFFSYNIIKLAE
jgi:hypothetical protein